jgi:hypothetical protein
LFAWEWLGFLYMDVAVFDSRHNEENIYLTQILNEVCVITMVTQILNKLSWYL